MITRIARFISIVGHPALLMPIAAAIAANSAGGSDVQLFAVVIAIFFAILVFAYSHHKTKSGDWQHIDASMQSERKELNSVAGVLLVVGAAILFLLKVNSGAVFAVGLSGVMVLCFHFLIRIAKPSLHVGFAVFATCLTYPNIIAMIVFFLAAMLIGWSRLYLARHTWLDLAVGALIGYFVGVCFQFLVHLSKA